MDVEPAYGRIASQAIEAFLRAFLLQAEGLAIGSGEPVAASTPTIY